MARLERFHVTYDTVSPESAESGDVSDMGFVIGQGWYISTMDSPVGEAFIPIKEANALRLREAINLLSCLENGGDGLSYYECDGRQNYRTGESTRYAFHLPRDTTAASVRRVARLLASLNLT